MISFDIETEPLAEDVLRKMLPEFDESSVATGNLKDPQKIAEKVAAAREKHERKFFEDAALDPFTSRVLVIAYHSPGKGTAIDDEQDEEKLIASFWAKACKMRSARRPMIGVNIHSFDLPYLVNRSWILGLDVPEWVHVGRYFDKLFVDLSERWRLGRTWQAAPASFSSLARVFGTDGKPEGTDGSMFHELWKTNREAAVAYVKGDVEQPAVWARRMGVAEVFA